ncbi:class I SAM-dependent methyltransferase [Halobacteriovorax sp.]|uniref:class I SAM-dependent methyltransferase n=1 Tax=Halobacteriovorax sp. TaxID=2020862 RepID=UPI00356393A7
MKSKTTAYGRFAKVYDFLSSLYSFGGISKLKKLQSNSINPGESILFAGAGGAEDAVLAAIKGASVVVVEISSEMIEQAKLRTKKSGTDLNIQFICDDIMNYRSIEKFDRIYCNFFLNVFEVNTVPKVVNHLLESLRGGGQFIIGDFAHSQGNTIQLLFQKIYFGLAAFFFVLTARNPVHRLYNYQSICRSLNVELKKIEVIKIFNFNAFMSLTFKKK